MTEKFRWICNTLGGSHLLHIDLLTNVRLNCRLANIDRQAQERFETLTEQMKQAQGITEQLKAENTLERVGRMNEMQA